MESKIASFFNVGINQGAQEPILAPDIGPLLSPAEVVGVIEEPDLSEVVAIPIEPKGRYAASRKPYLVVKSSEPDPEDFVAKIMLFICNILFFIIK